MTSLFESAPLHPGLPRAMVAELVETGGRGVSLLEFTAVDEPERQASTPTPVGDDLAASERARQVAVMIDAAREETAAQLTSQLKAEFALQVACERAGVERVCVEFARDRQRYFAAAEAQVVRLALAIARRVLAREVDGSTLPLEAVARAALAKVQDGSATVLRVRPEGAADWRAVFAGEPRLTVEEDARMAEGELVLETHVGTVELGVTAQFGEVERGFRELMER